MPPGAVSELQSISDIRNEDQLDSLERLHGRMVRMNRISDSTLVSLFELFARFPTSDAQGVFNKLMFAVETHPTALTGLLKSLNRAPSLMGVRMLARFLNDGTATCDGESLLQRMRAFGEDDELDPRIAQEVRSFLSTRG